MSRTQHNPGNDARDTWAGAIEADELFHQAMAREGRTPTPPVRKPGTAVPRTLPHESAGSCSSASGWDVLSGR